MAQPSAGPASSPAPAPVPATAADAELDLAADVLLLDMDGTLIDSGPAVERSWNALFAEMGSTRTFDHSLHGVPGMQVLAEVFPDLGAAEVEAAYRRVLDLEMADVSEILVLPGTRRVLEELDAAAAELGRSTWTIVTSCARPLFEARWAVTGLPVPARMVTADQVARGKPDPEPYLLGASRLGVDPARALVVEDSLGGLRSARAAGSSSLAVTTTSPAAALAPLADAVVRDLDDVRVGVEGSALRIRRRAS